MELLCVARNSLGVLLIFISYILAMRQIYKLPWIADYYSQRLIDLWTLTHMLHGLAFGLLSILLFGNIRIWFVFLLEITWELFENHPYVVSLFHIEEYKGDSISNSIVDIIACLFVAFLLKLWI